MQIELEELEYLKDEDILRQKIDEIFTFFKEKSIEIKTMPSMDYNDSKLTLQFFVSI